MAASFRDPSGFVYWRGKRLLRQINRGFAERWDELESSAILPDLQRRGLLIRHEPADLGDAYAPTIAHAVIAPEPLPFISYPYEWSFSQLRDAALATLEAQFVALARGYWLRDASAFNVQFRDGKPILIDTLSLERADLGRPWIAYRQFCEHFLAPLALMAYRDVRCSLLLRDFIDGIPLDFAARLLPGRTRLNLGLGSHVHVHARSQSRAADPETAGPRSARRMGRLRHEALLDGLRRAIERLKWRPGETAWAGYADHTSYSAPAEASKDAQVRRLLESAGGRVVWDLGANTGRFSAIAADLGRDVVAWDSDPGAAELHYLAIRQRGVPNVLPLLVDLANPSPGIGWANVERASFTERANADVVLALALVHHLNVGRNVRLAMIVELLATLAPQTIVEYVPESDPMVQRLLAPHRDHQPYPAIETFRDVFRARFQILEEIPVEDSARRLLRLSRKA